MVQWGNSQAERQPIYPVLILIPFTGKCTELDQTQLEHFMERAPGKSLCPHIAPCSQRDGRQGTYRRMCNNGNFLVDMAFLERGASTLLVASASLSTELVQIYKANVLLSYQKHIYICLSSPFIPKGKITFLTIKQI